MTQLQISIYIDDAGRTKVQFDKLKREDATPDEMMIATNMETIFVEQFKAVAAELGIAMDVTPIKAQP